MPKKPLTKRWHYGKCNKLASNESQCLVTNDQNHVTIGASYKYKVGIACESKILVLHPFFFTVCIAFFACHTWEKGLLIYIVHKKLFCTTCPLKLDKPRGWWNIRTNQQKLYTASCLFPKTSSTCFLLTIYLSSSW